MADHNLPSMSSPVVELMDTTLRDGEQTSGVTFRPTEKLAITKLLLEEVKVDRIEVASARVSRGECDAVTNIAAWARSKPGLLERIEVLGFVDEGLSLEWIRKTGARVMNLLCKGSIRHLREQLRQTPEEHLAAIRHIVEEAEKTGIAVNLYLEDWSNGIFHSPEYVFFLVDSVKDTAVRRIMLPDTLGILTPDQVGRYCGLMHEKYSKVRFDFHAHNDYDLAVANTLAAVRAGVSGVHTTVNGLGERTGNAPLSSVIAVLKDHLHASFRVNESKITAISKLVESFSGIRIPPNKPIIGENVFTQCCGVHADGDSKGQLYCNALLPERFGRVRKYALGKTSGKASIMKNLEELGIVLDPEDVKKVTAKIVELSDKKETITTTDLPFIISDVLRNETTEERVKIRNYHIGHAYGLKPVATLSIEIDGVAYEETATGDGQYDAFMNALTKIYHSLHKTLPELVDYVISIPPGGRTDALVEATITWKHHREIRTRGLDSDQTAAAIQATVKMLNLMENDYLMSLY